MKVFVLLYIRGKLQNPIFGNILNGFKKGLIDFEILLFVYQGFCVILRGKLRNPIFGNILKGFWRGIQLILKSFFLVIKILFYY